MPEPLPTSEDTGFHAWNPGLVSGLPRHVRPLATVFRPENVETPFAEIQELSDLSGLPATQLALFRPERLVVHEVLIRVMADLSVPLGAVYADLGVNTRRIAATIFHEGIAARLPEIAELLASIRARAEDLIDGELAALFDDPAPERSREKKPFGLPFFGRRPQPIPAEDCQARALRRLDDPVGEPDSLERCTRDSLRTVVASVVGRQGFLIRDRALLRRLAAILVSNAHGSRRIGATIEPWIAEVVARNGYRRVGAQDRPVVMNVKGASASGKSTIRPYQRALVERTGADWSDFAVITPDVWRKFLLDYDSLGPARRYAGPLTGHEVEIIDAKLDRYMARKAAEGRISHLLIDRFRFDSFSADARGDGTSQLLTRFGHRIYLQFMVTPPEATVERAWKRGEEFGRYKAVEDLLAHNVEAFAGMPRLFFLWALRTDKAVAFEFLDNTVPEGETPRTIAFGSNGAMTILDARALLDIDRFRRIDIHARTPREVYAGVDLAPERNAGFLRDCLGRLASVHFAERDTGRVFAQFARARLVGLDRTVLERVCADDGMRDALLAAGLSGDLPEVAGITETLRPEESSTLGAWGGSL
ncbi:hypothetical protein [Methylobacterium haplocladii]|uniref:Uncharacterized protein n=1 Tax=Methylobacterium haplocladii TaxID=1176176 RepID=A0A512IQK1_9HYPH|nr:hypothetical protein [Methylobacterium haplocladii]GEO99977.1 hypothetical protein MHA02_23650 [Methylobacterium haplocladii]GJD84532.1 hypothetical protein HPGCJGGD_2409 [Methylobacterium haplocladii]GLS60469.1 hypothetical protein GCM10007887_31480 [Methylobacterium haplocladii]